MAHAQKPDFVFRRNGRFHLNRRGRQFSLLLAAEVCASAVVMVVMLDTPCSELVWRVLATHSIRQFPLHFPSRASNVCHHISTGLYHNFSHYLIHGIIFGGRGEILNIKWMYFDFLYSFCLKQFTFWQKLNEIWSKRILVFMWSTRYSGQIIMKIESSR